MLNVITGNAPDNSKQWRGWFIGEFVTPTDDPRSTSDLEVKWGIHAAGECRSQWAEPSQTTTLSILISGCFRVQFPDGEVVLNEQGDYVLWLPGVALTYKNRATTAILFSHYTKF